MEKEVWHIFYLKITSLIAISTFLIVTSYLAVVFGNYYAFYETQYSVKFEPHEIHRQYWSQYIYICYLGSILACDLIACIAILFNLNYIILFAVFHHLTLLLVKIYSGFELNLPGEHTEGILILFLILHMIIIISLSLLYRKLDSVTIVKEILIKESNTKEQEKQRLNIRDNLNDKLINEYQQKFIKNDDRSIRSGSFKSIGKDSNRNIELEPMSVDIDSDFDTNKNKFQQNYQFNNGHHTNSNRNQSNEFRNRMQEDYDSDGYLKVTVNNRTSSNEPIQLIKNNQLTNSEDLILDQLNKRIDLTKNFDDSDVYLDDYIDKDFVDNDYDYLKCNIDDVCEQDENEHIYAQIKPKNIQSSHVINSRIENDKNNVKHNDPSKKIHKSVQTNQSINEPNNFHTTEHTADSNFYTKTAAVKESTSQFNNIKSRKIEYSTLKYDHKIFYESSV